MKHGKFKLSGTRKRRSINRDLSRIINDWRGTPKKTLGKEKKENKELSHNHRWAEFMIFFAHESIFKIKNKTPIGNEVLIFNRNPVLFRFFHPLLLQFYRICLDRHHFDIIEQ